MKKFIVLVFSSLFAMSILTSCVTAEAATATVAVESEYYDYGWNYVVVYIDGIANYRFWDDMYHRYYYRPVPRGRFGYIRAIPHGHRPVMHPSHHHRHMQLVPRHRHHQPTTRPSQHQPGRHSQMHQRSSTYHNNVRPHNSQPSHHSGGRFGGRR